VVLPFTSLPDEDISYGRLLVGVYVLPDCPLDPLSYSLYLLTGELQSLIGEIIPRWDCPYADSTELH
jgi:hypothetical protein